MKKLIASIHISLDGVVEAPETWFIPYADDEAEGCEHLVGCRPDLAGYRDIDHSNMVVPVTMRWRCLLGAPGRGQLGRTIGAITMLRTIAGQFSRTLVMAVGLTWSLASCGGGAPTNPGTGGAPTQLPSAKSSPGSVASLPASPTATASQRPEFSSTTEPATTAPVDAIAVEMAGPPPHYLPKDLVTKSGDVVFFVTNTSLGSHNIAIGRGPLKMTPDRVTNVPDALSGIVLTGHKATFSVDHLPPGAYVFWCTIDGHAIEGMNGTLTVNP